MPTRDDFWRWALARWQDSEVAAGLLSLQEDHHVVVLEVMLLAWLGRGGWQVSADCHAALVAVAQPWVAEVVLPLRQTRQQWRNDPARAAQRRCLQRVELRAEEELAELYFAVLAQWPLKQRLPEAPSPLRDNLSHALVKTALAEADLERLLELLSD